MRSIAQISHLSNLLYARHAPFVLEINAPSPLPPCSTYPSTTRLEDLSCCRWPLATQRGYKRSHVVWLDQLDVLFRPDCASHVGAGRGSQSVDDDVVLGPFSSHGLGEADDSTFLAR